MTSSRSSGQGPSNYFFSVTAVVFRQGGGTIFELSALLFVGLRASRSAYLKAVLRQNVGRLAAACGVSRYGYDRPIAGNPTARFLLQIPGWMLKYAGKPPLSFTSSGAARRSAALGWAFASRSSNSARVSTFSLPGARF